MSTSGDSGRQAQCAVQCSLRAAQGTSPAEGIVSYFLLSAKAFCSASACQGNPANIFVTLDDSYKAISVIAYRIDLIFIACQHRQNNNSDCQETKYGVEYITIKFNKEEDSPALLCLYCCYITKRQRLLQLYI